MTSRRITLALLALALAACGRKQAPQASATPPPLPADVRELAGRLAPSAGASAAPGAAAAAVQESGAGVAATGEFVSAQRSELVSKVTGRVGRILADEGARVRKGQPLLALEDDYLRLDVDRASAELARAESAAQDAERDLQRKTDLLAKGSVTQALYDRSRATAEQTRAAVQATRAAIDLARQRLADAVLRSPLDGVVAERHADVGERLGETTVAFVVVETAPLKLRFRLPERYVASVRPGQAVRAYVDPYPGEAFTGTISTAVQAIDPASRSFTVEAAFPNRDGRLRPGLFARVELAALRAPAAH